MATLAGLAAAGALADQAGLDVLCRGHAQLPHLVVFHVGGVVVASTCAALVTSIVRWRSMPDRRITN